MKVLFNPIYRLKVDKGKVLIFHRGGIVSAEDQHDEGFCGAIHPLHAIILSFLNGKEIDEAIEGIRQFIPWMLRNFITLSLVCLIANTQKLFVTKIIALFFLLILSLFLTRIEM